jgi:hypothetical protein
VEIKIKERRNKGREKKVLKEKIKKQMSFYI